MSQTQLLERIRGWSCPTNLAPDPYVRLLSQTWDAANHERIERINGEIRCPHCGQYWPLIESTEEWRLSRETGRWMSVGYGPGTAECLECERVFVDTFDGCFELKV